MDSDMHSCGSALGRLGPGPKSLRGPATITLTVSIVSVTLGGPVPTSGGPFQSHLPHDCEARG